MIENYMKNVVAAGPPFGWRFIGIVPELWSW